MVIVSKDRELPIWIRPIYEFKKNKLELYELDFYAVEHYKHMYVYNISMY